MIVLLQIIGRSSSFNSLGFKVIMVRSVGFDKPTALSTGPKKGGQAFNELRSPARIDFNTEIEETRRLVGAIQTENHVANKQMIDATRGLYEGMRGGTFGLGCNSEQVLDALRSIPAKERNALVATYKDNYERDLIGDLTSELSGKEKLEALALLQGADTRADAIGLYRTMATDVKRFEKTLAKLEGIPPPHREEVTKEYLKLTKRTLQSDLDAAFTGSTRELFRAILKGDQLEINTIKINRALENPTGNSEAIVKLLRSSDIDALATRHKEKEHKDLRVEVHKKLSGLYRDRADALFDHDTAKEGAIALKQATKKFTGSVEKVAAVLNEHPTEERKEMVQRFEGEFQQTTDTRITKNLPTAEAEAAKAILNKGALSLAEAVALELHRRKKHPERIRTLLGNKSGDELEALRAAYLERYDRAIESEVKEHFSGRNRYTILQALKGPAATLEEGVQRAKDHAKFERSGIAGIAVHAFTEKGTYVKGAVARAETFAVKASEDGIITPEETARGETLNRYAEANVTTFAHTKEQLAQQMGTVAAAGVGVATAGMGIVPAALLGGPSHIAGRALGDGKAYDFKSNVAPDALHGFVEGGLAAAGTELNSLTKTQDAGRQTLLKGTSRVLSSSTSKAINN